LTSGLGSCFIVSGTQAPWFLFVCEQPDDLVGKNLKVRKGWDA
jgi:hypothetical protein